MKKFILKTIRFLEIIKFWFTRILFAKSDYKLNFFVRLLYAFRGFSINEYYWYNLKNNSYKNYISEFNRLQAREINGDYKIILDDKIIFEDVFSRYVKVPVNYAYINNNNIYALKDFNISNDNFFDFLLKEKILVIKRLRGYEGLGFFLIKVNDDGNIFINDEQISKDDLLSFVLSLDDSIISEYIFQSSFASNLFYGSTNTIRIVCAKGKNDKSFKILKAVQRIGSCASAPVDNISAGGFASNIDLESGVLGPLISKCGDKNIRLKKFDFHPDTNNIISGSIIPDWDKLKNDILLLTSKFPYLNLVAWDVLLTEDGFCVIEGNASSGCGLFQLEHGIKNEEYGDILRSYNVFK